MAVMKIKSVVIASVCAAFLATGVAATGVAAAENPKSSAALQQAHTLLVSGKADQAIAAYTTILDQTSITVEERARALLNRALAHQKLDDHASAVNDYGAAISLDALDPKTRAAALYNRGLANARLQQNFAAVDDFTNALYLDPHMPEAFYSRANVLRDAGQYEYALIDYSRASASGYRHEHLAWYGKALTLMKLGHRDEATAALLRCYGIKPDFKDARDRLAELGVDVPVHPSQEQVKLAIMPAQNLMADDLVTGSTSTPAVSVAKVARKEPVAPPPSLLNGLKPDTPGITVAAAERATPNKPLPVRPDAISVADVGPVPAASAPVEAMTVTAAEPSPVATASLQVNVEPVSAPAPEVSTNLAAVALEKGVSERLEGWTVQLVSQRDAGSAWENWNKLQERHGKLLDGADAAVVKADLGDQGIYYRLRVHKLDSKQEADSLCRSLKRKGTNCFIARAS
jgi:tetratricopeptide (TPR) repeat protein